MATVSLAWNGRGHQQGVEPHRERDLDGASSTLKRPPQRKVGDRPDRYEPRVVKRRPKAYPRMQEPRKEAKARLAKAG